MSTVKLTLGQTLCDDPQLFHPDSYKYHNYDNTDTLIALTEADAYKYINKTF